MAVFEERVTNYIFYCFNELALFQVKSFTKSVIVDSANLVKQDIHVC